MAVRHSEQIVHKAAWLYYSHGLRQDEVAQQLGISRASVAMYLKRARETGIVSITTSTQLFGEELLARRIEDAFGLQSAWIVPDGGQALDPEIEMPVLAASVFLELVEKGNRIAVAWGKTVYQIADDHHEPGVGTSVALSSCRPRPGRMATTPHERRRDGLPQEPPSLRPPLSRNSPL